MSTVVGIAGPPGAGKTAVTRALAASLGDAVAVHIDSYQRVTREPMHRIMRWLERGANFDEFDIPLLPEHLARLKRGEAVTDPVTMREIEPRAYVVFETHFGRAHHATGRHIDFLVWLDTPLDVALARNVADFLDALLAPGAAEPGGERLAGLREYLARYLADVRRLALMQRERVGAQADLVVDGSAEVAQIAATIRAEILRRR